MKSDYFPSFEVRTDLAVEETEQREQQDGAYGDGIVIQEQEEPDAAVHVTRVFIKTPDASQLLNKPTGTYITLDAPYMMQNDGETHREISRVLAHNLRDLILPLQAKCSCVLVVGLGNADVTPDALGPRVLSNLLITRHLLTEGIAFSSLSEDTPAICGIVPGVMAQTGMETAEIVKALVNQICPDLVIVIDALAARSVTRLGTTIQLTDTGIHPGSGVGNHRHCLTKDSLGVPVIAIGVPTVVSAAAIVTDTMDALVQVMQQENSTHDFADELADMSADEKFILIRSLLEPRFGPMFVTPKDIDETIKRLSFTISEGINLCLTQSN